MPFAKRAIEPTRLSRSPLQKDYKFDLDCISNNTLCGLLRQLSSLAIKADSIFTEIAEECVSVAKKTKRIRNRVGDITKRVDKLNAKAVTVPVGDLATFAQHADHFQAEHGFDCYLFSPASRPDSVVSLYDRAAPSPISTIRRCNLLRSDGKTGSKFFSPALIINDEKTGEDLDTTHLSFRKPPVIKFRKPVQLLQLERETRELKEPRIKDRPHSIAVLHELDYSNNDQSTLPTPEQKLREISRSQPVTLVPIDVTGSSFNRMCDYRTSIRSINTQYEVLEEGTKSLRKKRHRRQTLSGMPGFVFDEISTDYFKVGSLRTRSVSRERWERPRSMVNDSLTSNSSTTPGRRARSRERKRHQRGHPPEQRDDSPVSKSCSLRRSFKSLFKGGRSRSQDLWAEGRPRSPGPPMIDLNVPLRRSRSLPRSLKSVMRDTSSFRLNSRRSASTEGRLDGWTEEELTERDIPWVRGKPPAAPARAIKAPRIPRSRSQTMTRRRSAYHQVDSSDDSSTTAGPARPHSLRTSLSQGQLRAPIPVCMPTTPTSTESLADTTQHRMNIPAGGAAWEPFASVRLRTPKGGPPDDRQSSSGNWSASSSSARQSLESDYNRLVNNSPEKRSQTSLDKDSALSLNIHSSSEDRYTTDNNGDLGEETSTLTGDTSTINGETATEDTSTINGDVDSVIDVKANFTKMNAEDWLNSIKREKRASRRKSKHDSLDNGSGLTQQNLRAHDHAHKPFVRSLSRLPDEESSVYSVDQEGFYTSMHRDSGLKRSQSEMIEEETQWQLSMDSFMSSSNSTLASSTPASKPSRAEKARRRSTSFLSNLPGLKKLKSSSKNKNKKTPPPPPKRGSTVLDKSNLTLHLEHPGSPPTPSSELSKSADTSTETVINTSMQVTPQKGGHNDSSCESDAEAIYARLKTKTSISAAGIPSLCSVTPICSDEEDADMLSFSRSWKGQVPGANPNDTSTWTGSLVSTKSAPGSLLEGTAGIVTSTPLHSRGTTRNRLDSSGDQHSGGVDLSISDTMALHADISGDSSGFSTWPRTPASKTGAGDQKAPCPSRNLNFTSSGFDPRDARNVIPEAKTPDQALKSRGLTARHSFRGSNDGSMGGSERSSSKGTSSIHSPSNSSIPSSFSDDMPPIPGKIMSVQPEVRGLRSIGRPGEVASLSGGSGGSACTSPVNKAGHVYAHVVVQNSGPRSATSSTSSLSFGGSNMGLPTSPTSLTSPNGDYISVNSTWPRAAKSTADSPKEGGVSGKPDKKRFSTFSKPEKEAVVQEECNKEEPLSVPVTSYNGPVPAPAKLIISSPVATKVSFKENPYKRSVCSPVTTQELMSFWNQSVKDKPYNSPVPSALDGSDLSSREPSPSAFKPVLPAPRPSTSQVVSRPLFPSLSSMKHSISFPIPAKKEEKPEPAATTPSSYGRSWYEGISSPKKTSSSEVVPITTAPALSRPGSSIQSQISLTSFISDSPTPSLLDQRRDSISSNVSSDSGSKKHVTFATVNKASPASSQFSLKMDDGTASMTGSITGSIGSNESSDRKPTFSSFTKLPTVSPTNSLKKGSSMSGNLKGILSAPVPTPGPPATEGNTQTRTPLGSSSQVGSSLKSTSGQSYHRPTSLALSKTVDTPSRLQSIGEGQSAEDFSATASAPTLVGAGARKPSPVRTSAQKQTEVVVDKKAPEATGSNTSLQAKPVAAVTASGADRALPSLRPWPGKNTGTGPSKSPAKDTIQTKQEEAKATTSKQPQTARVTPTVKMPKMTSFKPVSTVAPTTKLSLNSGKENSTKSPTHNTTDTKADQKVNPQPPNSTKSKVESPTKSANDSSKVAPASVSKVETSKTEGVKACSPATPSGTKVDKQEASGSSTNTGTSGKVSASESKPPSGPTSAKVSPRMGATRPSVLSTDTKTSPTTSSSNSKYQSVLTTSSTSLTPSTGTNGSSGNLTNSTSTLSLASNSSILGSKLSLNKSTDSLASNGSNSSVIERNRAARLAFLNSGSCQAASNASPPSPDNNTGSDPFSRYKVGGSPPGSNTCTGTPPPPNSVNDRFARYKIGQRKNSTGSLTSGGSGSPTSPTCTGPSQGRFVNSVIDQLATKTEGDPPSPTTPSSGLGSSIASPQSPLKTLTPHNTPSKGTDLDIKASLVNGVKATGVVPPNINNNNNITDTQTNTSSLDAKKETCC